MARVDGLYGHIQRNNRKVVILIATFLAVFLIVQFSFRLIWFWPMAKIEASGFVLRPMRDTDSLASRLLGMPIDSGRSFQHRVAILKGDETEMPTPTPSAADDEPLYSDLATGPQWTPTILDAVRLMFTRSQYLGWQCLALMVFALYYVMGSARRTGLLIRYATRARPLERREYPALYNLVENLALTAGLPCPAIELIESPKLNAYATGLTAATARLGLTTGLIETLDRHELEAVIAHELTHVRHGDTRLMAVTRACADLVLEQPTRIWRSLRDRPRYVPSIIYIPFFALFLLPALVVPFIVSPMAFVILIAIPATAALVALLCKAMMHHSREFVADAGAIELTKKPRALIAALRKMAGSDAVLSSSITAQAMMFAGSEGGGWLSTHPTYEARVEAIQRHAGVMPDEVHAPQRRERVARPHVHLQPQARQPAVFGRRAMSRTLPGRPAGPDVGRNFALKSAPGAIWDDHLPPPPPRGQTAGSAPQPTLWEQIEMEGFQPYLNKRPWLYIPFILVAMLVHACLAGAIGFS